MLSSSGPTSQWRPSQRTTTSFTGIGEPRMSSRHGSHGICSGARTISSVSRDLVTDYFISIIFWIYLAIHNRLYNLIKIQPRKWERNGCHKFDTYIHNHVHIPMKLKIIGSCNSLSSSSPSVLIFLIDGGSQPIVPIEARPSSCLIRQWWYFDGVPPINKEIRQSFTSADGTTTFPLSSLLNKFFGILIRKLLGSEI